MKVIIVGATGFIGQHVTRTCLADPAITSIVLLSRRRIPMYDSIPNMRVLVVDDFTLYDASVVDEIRGADGCIWCMGTKRGDFRVDYEFPLEFLRVVRGVHVDNGVFRHVHLGGVLTEMDQERSLWFAGEGRRMRGRAELNVLNEARTAKVNSFEGYVFKPARVLAEEAGWEASLFAMLGPAWSVGVQELAVVLVDVVVNGGGETVLDNKAILDHARRISR